jgi:hypothetical protein
VRVLGAVVGRDGIVGAVISLMGLVVGDEWLVLLVLFFVMSEAADHLMSLVLLGHSSFVERGSLLERNVSFLNRRGINLTLIL